MTVIPNVRYTREIGILDLYRSVFVSSLNTKSLNTHKERP